MISNAAGREIADRSAPKHTQPPFVPPEGLSVAVGQSFAVSTPSRYLVAIPGVQVWGDRSARYPEKYRVWRTAWQSRSRAKSFRPVTPPWSNSARPPPLLPLEVVW